MHVHWPRWVGVLSLLAGLAGCSGSGALYATRGKVVVGGKGAGGAIVYFHPHSTATDAPRPSAVCADDGSFTLTTGTSAGAPAGEYRVSIIWPGEPPAKKGKAFGTSSEGPDRPDRLGGRYANPDASKLTATVRSGANDLPPFELK